MIQPNRLNHVLEFESYEKLWEQEMKWPEGKEILSQICDFLKDKTIQADGFYHTPNPHFEFILPLPYVFNIRLDKLATILFQIPPEIKHIFVARYSLIVHEITSIHDAVSEKWAERIYKEHSKDDWNDQLLILTKKSQDEGYPTVSQIAEYVFGLNDFLYPHSVERT